jgi:hypothetical protein
MTIKVQMELSDEEGKIVELYRLQHNKKSNEDAAREIIKQYKPLAEYKEKNKKSWMDNLTKI